MVNVDEAGFELRRGILDSLEIEQLRSEADRLSTSAANACVRMLTQKSPLFRELAHSVVIKELVGEGRIPVRSILFDKTTEENWPVLWHQDLTIAVRETKDVEGYSNWSLKERVPHVQPPLKVLEEMITVRLHLDPTPESNGALRVIPRSHLFGRIAPDAIGGMVKSAGEQVCKCDPGDVLLMSPLILHSSRKSKIPSRRRVLHFEYANPTSLAESLAWWEEEAQPASV